MRYNYGNISGSGSGALTPSRVAPKGVVPMPLDSTSNQSEIKTGKRGGTGLHGKHRRGRKVQWIPITCEECGGIREFTPGEVRQRGKIRFCSRACYVAHGRVNPPKPTRIVVGKMTVACAHCGKAMSVSPSKAKRAKRLFCSRACHGLARRVYDNQEHDQLYTQRYMREYVQRNREKHNERGREWAKDNRDKRNANQRSRR
jgi:hypothetical protein